MDIQYLLNPDSATEATAYANPPKESEGSQQRSQVQEQFTSRKRPGRVSKSISARTSGGFSCGRKRVERSYPREFKIAVLKWWLHYKIPQKEDERNPGVPRTPLLKEVSERYLVPITTLHNWRAQQDKIINCKKGERKGSVKLQNCRWPELESDLYNKYCERRDQRKTVRRNWLRREAYRSYTACYPSGNVAEFRFSDGWFSGFLSRHSITLRFTTNKSQKVPHDYLSNILSWMCFNRRNSQVRPDTSDREREVGRYMLDSICNLDETPLPFEYLDGQTYADKGSSSVQVKATTGGWDKRQATLLLAVFGSGKSQVRPLIIFRGKESYEGRRSQYFQRKREEEEARYDTRVQVCWNETAYANANLLINWIQTSLIPILPTGPRLLTLDVAKFHYTDEVLSTLSSHEILPSLIPAGCTGLVQPLDVSVNKPFKNILRNILEDLLDNYEDQYNINLHELSATDTSAIAERRILVTHAVGQAWEEFSTKYQDLVFKTFRSLGLTLPVDGSCDSELSVKGIDPSNLKITNSQWDRHGEQRSSNQVNTTVDLESDVEDGAAEFIDRI